MRKQSGLVPIDEVVSGLDDELVLAIRNDSPQARHSFTVADQVDRLVSASETDPDREPVCEPHDSTGEPGAGNRPAGFGERGEETCPWESACGPAAKAPDEPPTPLPATRLPSTLPDGTLRYSDQPHRLDRRVDQMGEIANLVATLRWVSGSDVRQQIQFINQLFEVVA